MDVAFGCEKCGRLIEIEGGISGFTPGNCPICLKIDKIDTMMKRIIKLKKCEREERTLYSDISHQEKTDRLTTEIIIFLQNLGIFKTFVGSLQNQFLALEINELSGRILEQWEKER